MVGALATLVKASQPIAEPLAKHPRPCSASCSAPASPRHETRFERRWHRATRTDWPGADVPETRLGTVGWSSTMNRCVTQR